MNLGEIFEYVFVKQLAKVDHPYHSNQQAIGGLEKLRRHLGLERGNQLHGIITWHYFADGQEPAQAEEAFTLSDVRFLGSEQTKRGPEWHLYYKAPTGQGAEDRFLRRASPRDTVYLVRLREEGSGAPTHGLVFQRGSSWLRAAVQLFHVDGVRGSTALLTSEELRELTFSETEQALISELDLPIAVPAQPTDKEIVERRFGHTFPATEEMSRFAESQVEVDLSDADTTLERWINREEQLFRALEELIVQDQVKRGFASVEEFMNFSLKAHNRRKARAGRALENHLSSLFSLRGLQFERNVRTEGNNRPDFLFPGSDEYSDGASDSAKLAMLAAKSTCKDRWRQILTEANRIPVKHLCTLERAISAAQTEEMRFQRVQLVIPAPRLSTFSNAQRQHLITVEDFVRHVAALQQT